MPEYRNYQVKKGDSLWTIAVRNFNDPGRVNEIMALNNLRPGQVLQIGVVLRLPVVMAKDPPRLADPFDYGPPPPPIKKAELKEAPKKEPTRDDLLALLGASKFTLSVLNNGGLGLGIKMAEMASILMGEDFAKVSERLEVAGKFKDGKDAIISLFDMMICIRKGDTGPAIGNGIMALGALVQVMPSSKALERVRKALASHKLTRDLAASYTALHAIGALGDVAKMLGALFLFDSPQRNEVQAKFLEGLKGLCQKVSQNPTPVMALLPTIAETLVKLLPERLRKTLLLKLGAKKIPLLGTIVVGTLDIIEIVRDPREVSSWLGLGSTLTAMIPGAGTAASVALDIVAIGFSIAENVKEVSGDDITKVLLPEHFFEGWHSLVFVARQKDQGLTLGPQQGAPGTLGKKDSSNQKQLPK